MDLDINAIFNQKLAEIENRLAGITDNKSNDSSKAEFEKYLSDAALLGMESSDNSLPTGMPSSFKSLLDSLGDDETASKNLLKARFNLSKSKAYIPNNVTELMNMINSAIDSSSQKYGVDKDLIRAVMKQESSFDPTSISKAGAQGLMQLMPDTAEALNIRNPFDIIQNINGGAQYLKDQLTRFNGDISLALAAYNAGPNAVEKYRGIPPYTETQDYVKKVTNYYNQYKMSSSVQR